MMHIIKWKCQPEKRASSWETTIISARDEIADIQEEVPSLNRNYLESIWETSFKKAIRQAESEMGKRYQLMALSWQEVFEDEYSLFDYN
ncbi:hypothetical protein NO108_00078 [Planktothrix rubescens]|jgi:hypothetical protein|nr:hypothetical protein NO108_00078 [Planktothrix rubescens]